MSFFVKDEPKGENRKQESGIRVQISTLKDKGRKLKVQSSKQIGSKFKAQG
jgi:hypothetical protein